MFNSLIDFTSGIKALSIFGDDGSDEEEGPLEKIGLEGNMEDTQEEMRTFKKANLSINQKKIQNGIQFMDMTEETKAAISDELMEIALTSKSYHVRFQDLPEYLLERPFRHYVFAQRLEYTKDISIEELKGDKPIQIKLSELMNAKNPQERAIMHNLLTSTMADSLQISINEFYCNFPGSLDVTVEGSAIGPKKETAYEFSKAKGMFQFARTRKLIYSRCPETKKFYVNEFWLQYMPRAQDIMDYVRKVTQKGKPEKYILEKNYITMIMMASLEDFLREVLPEESIKFNGDPCYYCFNEAQWGKIKNLIGEILTPVEYTKLVIEITPCMHEIWETMLYQDVKLKKIMTNKQRISSDEVTPADIGSVEVEAQENNSIVTSYAIDLRKPIQKFPEVFSLHIVFEISYRPC
jgi:hypothetical protein